MGEKQEIKNYEEEAGNKREKERKKERMKISW